MFKLGVHDVRQLRSGKITTLFGRRKRISVRLLNDLEGGEYEDCFARVTHDLVDDRGAFKRTQSDRFSGFDEVAIDLLRRQNFGDQPLAIHDIAVSNGQTAVDFYNALVQALPNVEYDASDYDHELTCIREGSLWVTISSSGKVVEIARPPFVFTPAKYEHPWVYPLNHLVCFVLQRTAVPRLLARYREGRLAGSQVEKIELFCPEAQRLASTDPAFRLSSYDVMQEMPGGRRYACVRAMNVLNRNYFSPHEMQTVLTNICGSMVEGGLLIAGSNQYAGSVVNGGVFELRQGKLGLIYESGANEFLRHHVEQFNGATGSV